MIDPRDASVEAAQNIDLGCTTVDDHDSPRCWKCEGIREQIAQAIAAHTERVLQSHHCGGCNGSDVF